MQQQPRLFIPALGGIYRTFAPITEPLIRVVAGGSLAMDGFPILFRNIGAADKFLESTGFQNGLFWAYVVGAVEFVCGLFLALGFLTRVVPHRSSAFSSSPSWQFGFASENRGIKYPLFWSIVVLYFVVRGGGPWSLDALIGREL